MKYVGLLRGINVGGKGIIKMAELKAAVENCGFAHVKTFIQSGNVIFESDEEKTGGIAARIEEYLLKTFKINSQTIVITYDQIKKVVLEVPSDWNQRKDLRCYIAFIREPVKPQEVLKQIRLKEGVDFAKAGEGVVYLTTLLSGLTKSGFAKLVSTKVYKDITIRNYSTVQKLLTLMEE